MLGSIFQIKGVFCPSTITPKHTDNVPVGYGERIQESDRFVSLSVAC